KDVNVTSASGNAVDFSSAQTMTFTSSSASSVNVISSTTGIALSVVNTTIGAAGLNFKSISANGASSGIVLNNTGSSGGLTVTGTGSAGTGGTIQNISARGASFISARNISLNWMNFTNANTTNGSASNGTVGGSENTNENGAINLASAVNVSLSNINISGTTVQHGINGNNDTKSRSHECQYQQHRRRSVGIRNLSISFERPRFGQSGQRLGQRRYYGHWPVQRFDY